MRTSWQALCYFLKQDLRDYRLKDYDALPAKARWLLLGFSSILLSVICIVIWRVAWFNDWQVEQNALQTRLLRQIDLLSLKESEYQNFLTSDRVAEVNFLLEEIQRQESYHHNSNNLLDENLLDEIMAIMRTFTGEVIQFSPKFESLELSVWQEKTQYRSGIMRRSTTMKALSNLELRNLTLLWNRLQDLDSAPSSPIDLPLDRLRLTLELCGDQNELYLFLNALINLPNYLTYVDSLKWESTLESQTQCNSHETGYLQGVFYFYSINRLTEYSSQLLQDQVVEGMVPLPNEIPQIKRGWEHWKSASYQPRDRSLDMDILFFKRGDRLKDRNTQSEELTVWKVGEFYQGRLLVGLFTRGSQRYAIITTDNNSLQNLEIVTEGGLGIRLIDIPTRQVLISPLLEIVDEEKR